MDLIRKIPKKFTKKSLIDNIFVERLDLRLGTYRSCEYESRDKLVDKQKNTVDKIIDIHCLGVILDFIG